jgi:hypothetical protein
MITSMPNPMLGRAHGSFEGTAEAATRAAWPSLITSAPNPIVQSLAMVAEVVHGAPYRFRDPARFSLAEFVLQGSQTTLERSDRASGDPEGMPFPSPNGTIGTRTGVIAGAGIRLVCTAVRSLDR